MDAFVRQKYKHILTQEEDHSIYIVEYVRDFLELNVLCVSSYPDLVFFFSSALGRVGGGEKERFWQQKKG